MGLGIVKLGLVEDKVQISFEYPGESFTEPRNRENDEEFIDLAKEIAKNWAEYCRWKLQREVYPSSDDIAKLEFEFVEDGADFSFSGLRPDWTGGLVLTIRDSDYRSKYVNRDLYNPNARVGRILGMNVDDQFNFASGYLARFGRVVEFRVKTGKILGVSLDK